jgi:DNA primase
MAGRIPDDALQLIRDRVSIVEVVSGYVSLKKAGRNHVGLCPFHAEKTPSFTVNDDRGLFHCFGCGAGGSVFTFLMRAESISFREAVELLARRAGIELPRDSERDGGDQRRPLIELNDTAQRFFRAALGADVGASARRYLERRGVSGEIIERYGLGFCPASGSALGRALASRRQPLQKAVDLGLLGRRADGSTYDRLRGRVTFPIRDGSGNVLGFGGRTLGDDQPKYLNSPESSLFHKGSVLYGLYEARQAIRDAGRVIIVEGYLDALALVDAGIAPVVASLGTALTASQLRLARRFAPQVLAFFVGDPAGQQAAERAFALCAECGVWGLGAFLPNGFDPDTFVRQRGVEATQALLDSAEPLAEFFLRRIDPGPDASLPARAAAAERVRQVIGKMTDAVQFSLLARRAAERLHVDEAVLRDVRRGSTAGRGERPDASVAVTSTFRPEEMTLVEAMAFDREAARIAAEAGIFEAFNSATLAEAGRAVVVAWQCGQGHEAIVDRLPPELSARVAAGVLGEGPVSDVSQAQIARDCIARIRARALRQRTRELQASLQEAESTGDDTRVRQELERASELLRRKVDGHA